jgi:peptidoglycan L-alanyl-D-glutamate endopeptidase CwlK
MALHSKDNSKVSNDRAGLKGSSDMKVVYGDRSQAAFDTLDARAQTVLLFIKDVLEIDHSVLEGYRVKAEQNRLFGIGASQLQWPDSSHNQTPSLAVDVVPYVRIAGQKGGIHWHNKDPKIQEMYYREMVRFATVFQMVALLVFGYECRWGGDWSRNWSIMDNKFNDYPHIEFPPLEES